MDYLPDSLRTVWWMRWSKMAAPHIFGGENYKIHRIATAAPPAILTKIFVIRAFYCVKWLLTHIFGGIKRQKAVYKQACNGFYRFIPCILYDIPYAFAYPSGYERVIHCIEMNSFYVAYKEIDDLA